MPLGFLFQSAAAGPPHPTAPAEFTKNSLLMRALLDDKFLASLDSGH